jgi:hypothetical protein
MLMLSLDFNLERRYRALHQSPGRTAAADPAGAPAWALGLFRGFYQRVLAPQDRAIDALDEALFARLYGLPYPRAPQRVRQAWNDLFSTASLVNLGLSTQLLLMAALLLAREPFAYVLALWLMAGYVLLVSLWRSLRFLLQIGARR